MANTVTGYLYKKVMNADGTVKSTVPFLLKTWAGFVFMNDGTSVQSNVTNNKNAILSLKTLLKTAQDDINALKTKKTYFEYETLEAYKADYEAGNIPEGTLCIVKNTNGETEI